MGNAIHGFGAPETEGLIGRGRTLTQQHLSHCATHGFGPRNAIASAELAQGLKLRFGEFDDRPHDVII